MELLRVADTLKRVTDPVMLAALARQGIDRDRVEFTEDYCRKHPYSKLYKGEGKSFAVFSGLPMVDAYGYGHELEWRDKNGIIENGNNIFHATVIKSSIALTALSNQSFCKKDATLAFHPQLFFNDVEVKPVSGPSLLETDPVNPNYCGNVLEWDYGICKRRIRLIEGRFLGSWVFFANPGGNIGIRYNQSGDFRLKLGQFKSGDEEFIPKEYFDNPLFGYPLTIPDSATFYPDADPETSSVDGWVRADYPSGASWATIRAAAGSAAYDYVTSGGGFYIQAGGSSGLWLYLMRGISVFYTAGLPDAAEITDAVISYYGSLKNDTLGISPNINVYSSNPASHTELVAGDFDSLGSTAFCDSPIAYAGWSTTGYNDFTLNVSGIAAISKTGVSEFGVRNANYDVRGTTPSWSSGAYSRCYHYHAEQGSGYKPKLVVTYTAGEGKTSADSGTGSDVISIRTQEAIDQGAGEGTGLAGASFITGDGGGGIEAGGLLKSVSGNDAGAAADALRTLVRKAGSGLKLHSRYGQMGIPHKEVSL